MIMKYDLEKKLIFCSLVVHLAEFLFFLMLININVNLEESTESKTKN